jgi:predicted unusual protein kinase regulating ubiquinone biosynthesis (AarF/ABC1/UbiB family)
MSPTLSELMAALPDAEERPEEQDAARQLPELALRYERRPLPAGLFRRLTLLGALPAKIAVAWGFHWLRGWRQDEEGRERDAAETRFRLAAHVLDTMSYLRGAAMKLGQFLGSLPEVLPEEFSRAFERLHFEAPPMHHALVRELLQDELGGEPEHVFAAFEREAFAAASLGQVHRARLKSGEVAAVKVQYPGIARAIRSDLRMLVPLLLPARLGRDGESLQGLVDYVRRAVERETDYEREAETQERARALFRDEDGIVVPRVFGAQSTKRVLSQELLDGVHLDALLERDPPQAERDRWGEKLMRAWYRLFYAGRMHQIDWNGGNFLFLPDGRLGLLDFGAVIQFSDEEWELMRAADRPLTTGRREDRLSFLSRWIGPLDEKKDERTIRLSEAYMEWSWRPRASGGVFDFGDGAELRRGIEILGEVMRARMMRGQPCSGLITRWDFLYRGLLHRLGARVGVARIAEEEIAAAGWDRTEYKKA